VTLSEGGITRPKRWLDWSNLTLYKRGAPLTTNRCSPASIAHFGGREWGSNLNWPVDLSEVIDLKIGQKRETCQKRDFVTHF
jgi:hypothetical protein